MDRVILHCDLNNFYASAETVYHPQYRDVPLAVGGREELRHGIVLAKNQLAKAYGIKTGDTLRQAREKCPGLVIVPPNFSIYYKFSRKVQEIYLSYTRRVESFGIDECWLDLTGGDKVFGPPDGIAEELRWRVKRETGLTISVGVSFTKVFAKLGSDYKKPDAVTVIDRNNFRDLIWPLPANHMLGVGRKTYRRLQMMGLLTIGDLARADRKFLQKHLGINGEKLWQYANGIDPAPVLMREETPLAKSMGRSITLPRDITKEEDAWKMLLLLSEDLLHAMRKAGLKGKYVELTVRDSGLFDHTAYCISEEYVVTAMQLASHGMKLYRERGYTMMAVRALGIRVCRLVSSEDNWQMDLYENTLQKQRRETLEKKMEEIRGLYGEESICRAVLLKNVPYKIGAREERQPTFGVKV